MILQVSWTSGQTVICENTVTLENVFAGNIQRYVQSKLPGIDPEHGNSRNHYGRYRKGNASNLGRLSTQFKYSELFITHITYYPVLRLLFHVSRPVGQTLWSISESCHGTSIFSIQPLAVSDFDNFSNKTIESTFIPLFVCLILSLISRVAGDVLAGCVQP